MSIQDLLPAHIRNISPYIPGKPVEEVERELGICAVKLASNENPLGPSPLVVEAVSRFLRHANRYPTGDGYYLREKLAGRLGISMDEIILGSGSSELLELVARAFLTSSDEALTSEKSFVMYYLAPQQMNCPVRQLPMKNYTYDLEAIRQAVTPRTKVIYLANPNNPTGTMFPAVELDRFLKDLPDHIIVVVDEAYYEYVEDPGYSHSLDYLKKYANVLVLRTFSKAYALAGFRIGYGIGQPELVNALHKVRPPFNTSSLGQVAALAALDDLEYVRHCVEANRDGYRYLSEEMKKMKVFFVPSVANFILVETGRDGMEEFQKLLRHGVIVRPMKANGFPHGFRVSIGSADENEKYLSALKAILPQP
jgi:histidinol-phosphate aminotransferase